MRPIKNIANIYVHHTYTSTIIPIKINIALQLYNQFGNGKKKPNFDQKKTKKQMHGGQ